MYNAQRVFDSDSVAGFPPPHLPDPFTPYSIGSVYYKAVTLNITSTELSSRSATISSIVKYESSCVLFVLTFAIRETEQRSLHCENKRITTNKHSLGIDRYILIQDKELNSCRDLN